MKTQKARASKKGKHRLKLTFRFGLPETPYPALRETRKKCKDKIAELLDHLAGFYALPVNIMFYSVKACMKHWKSKTDIDTVETLIFYNEVITPTIHLCINEFHVFISELQTAAYSGAARTLRCILETAVEACEFQSEEERPTYDMLTKEYDLLVKMPKKKEKVKSFLMQRNARISFTERYKIYQQTKRIAPTFKELVNRLNSRQMFQKAPQIVDEVKRTYEILSDYVHPSLAKIERQLGDREPPIIPRFDSKEFDIIYEMGLKTLDIIQFLYIKSISYFLGFEDAKAFLKELARHFRYPSEVATKFLKLPFCKRLSHGIRWQVTKKTKKHRKSTKVAKSR